jgi:hypothetical protein
LYDLNLLFFASHPKSVKFPNVYFGRSLIIKKPWLKKQELLWLFNTLLKKTFDYLLNGGCVIDPGIGAIWYGKPFG